MPQLLLVSLLEVEAAVVQGLVVVLLENLGEEWLHVLLHLAPLAILLLQAGQHHRNRHSWVLLQQVYDVVTRVSTCTQQNLMLHACCIRQIVTHRTGDRL